MEAFRNCLPPCFAQCFGIKHSRVYFEEDAGVDPSLAHVTLGRPLATPPRANQAYVFPSPKLPSLQYTGRVLSTGGTSCTPRPVPVSKVPQPLGTGVLRECLPSPLPPRKSESTQFNLDSSTHGGVAVRLFADNSVVSRIATEEGSDFDREGQVVEDRKAVIRCDLVELWERLELPVRRNVELLYERETPVPNG